MHYGSHETLYNQYEDTDFLKRIENYALWTIASAFPDNYDWQNIGNQTIEHDYQSIGAILTNNLAAKLTGLLFPAAQSYFKLNWSEDAQKIIEKEKGFNVEDAKTELARIEREACKRIFSNAGYAQLQQMMLYLVITGNALLKRNEGKTTVYSLRNYTLLRDNSGTVLDIVLKECVAYGSLSDEVRMAIANQCNGKKEFDDITVYTRVKREYTTGNNADGSRKSKWIVSQQIHGIDVGKPSTYPEKLCPYVPIGWKLVNGDSYCRGLVEDYAGDFAKLSDLSRALALYQIDACKVVNLVKPGSNTTDIDELNNAENGEWVQADPDAVSKHEGGEYQKLQALSNEVQLIFQRLSIAFMYQGNMRDAERVTAAEISYNAAEADKTLGGVYSQLSASAHEPLAYLLSSEVDKALIAAFGKGEIQLDILTGLTALSRAADVNALIEATNVLNAIVPALKTISQRFDVEKIIDMVLVSKGLDPTDYMLSEQALAEQQSANQAAMSALDPLAQQQAIQGIG